MDTIKTWLIYCSPTLAHPADLYKSSMTPGGHSRAHKPILTWMRGEDTNAVFHFILWQLTNIT